MRVWSVVEKAGRLCASRWFRAAVITLLIAGPAIADAQSGEYAWCGQDGCYAGKPGEQYLVDEAVAEVLVFIIGVAVQIACLYFGGCFTGGKVWR